MITKKELQFLETVRVVGDQKPIPYFKRKAEQKKTREAINAIKQKQGIK